VVDALRDAVLVEIADTAVGTGDRETLAVALQILRHVHGV
jgi:hypothetical protein